MALTKCPHCGQSGRVPDNLTGRQVRCPKCGEPFTVKAMPEAAASAPAQRPKAQAPAAPGGRTAPQRPAPAQAPAPAKGPARAPARPAKGPGGTPPPAIIEEDEDEIEQETGPVEGRSTVEYMRAVKFGFANPKWLVNCLLMAVGMIIPVVGGIVVGGYTYDVAEHTLRGGDDREYPPFDFGKFGKYLMRGLWPTILAIVFMLPLGLVYGIVAAVGSTLPFMFGKDLAIVGTILSLVVWLIALAILVVGILLILPATFRAGLSQQLAFGPSISFARDFLKRCFGAMLLGMIVVGFLTGLLNMVGMIACGIGTLITMPATMLANANLMAQLYQLYLHKGGEPIPLKEE
jgi:predicted Zn finger-like uncharacterized protein